MGFNRANYRRIKQEYEGKALRAQEEALQRKRELGMRFPDIRELDDRLSGTGLQIFEATVRMKGEKLEKEISRIKEENAALLKKRAELLSSYGLPSDYSDVKYECNECSDSGFVGLYMCKCMKTKLVMAGYESSGIGSLIRTKTFDNYVPSYQKDKSAVDNAEMIVSFCRSYAEGFGDKSQNLLFIGGTGLGKTHLSAAITGAVIRKGYDVVCETAQNLFSDFEFERFGRSYNRDDAVENRTDRYFESDLLIIDDLGTEMANQFTVSCLYNVINTRLNKGRPVIINTNLTRDELKKRYSDRITSRLFGEFLPIMFIGRDMRELKLD